MPQNPSVNFPAAAEASSAARLCKPSTTKGIRPDARFVLRDGRELLLNAKGELPTEEDCKNANIPLVEPLLVAVVGEKSFYCIQPIENKEIIYNSTKIAIRAFLHAATPAVRQAVTRVLEMDTWRQEHRFCGKCGALTLLDDSEGALKCVRCGFKVFPVLSPAIIVRITRGRHEILLGRNAFFTTPFFSNFAGYVESGENLEEAIQREILEEVGIKVKNLQYFGSQNWPFPHTLLAAFTAEYHAGELRPDGTEIVEAAWFDARQPLPPIPQPGSISRALIDDFLANQPSQ